jgi:hypothetical protein
MEADWTDQKYHQLHTITMGGGSVTVGKASHSTIVQGDVTAQQTPLYIKILHA